MSTPPKLYTFKDLLEIVPLGRTALRDRLSALGYNPNGKKLLISENDLPSIIDAIATRPPERYSNKAIPAGTSLAAMTAKASAELARFAKGTAEPTKKTGRKRP